MKCNDCTAPMEACNCCEEVADATPIVFEDEYSCTDGVCGINWG